MLIPVLEYPEIALAKSLSQGVTHVIRLPKKTGLNVERQVRCRITHVVSPSEFFVRPLEEDAPCLCSKVETHVKLTKLKEGAKTAELTMDPYFFGHSAIDPGQEMSREEKVLNSEDELHSFLSQAFNYTRFQKFKYLEETMVELVAAFVNNKWKRAVILNQMEEISTTSDEPRVWVQLLDSGEKALLPMKQVCRLPEKFVAKPAAVIQLML